MDADKYLMALKKSVVNLDFKEVIEAARASMEAGVDPQLAIDEGMVPAMAAVGDKYENGEYFLSELVVAAEVMREGLEIITPYIKGNIAKRLGNVVMATVEGDHHDLGKNIVTSLLSVQGFEVTDLGTDVTTKRIIEAVQVHNPVIVGMSALLTVTMPKMGEVIVILKEAGLRDKVKVIVGGTSVTAGFAESIGADHRAVNALEGVKKCVEWVTSGERRQ